MIRDRLETITLGPRPAGALTVENGPSDTTRETYLFAIADLAVSIAWHRLPEDEYGHVVDQAGNLVYDPRCYFCLNSDDGPRQVAYVKVEVTPA